MLSTVIHGEQALPKKPNLRDFNEHAYQVGWNWFDSHASQRMDLFRFYIALSVAFAAGCWSLVR
jgi:hypothetical protein